MSKNLLWIGAGKAQEFDFDYTKYTKVIFVDPLLHIAAEEQIKDKEKFVTVQKAVTTRAVNTQQFKLFNNEEFSSFLEPGVLKEIYPNLHVEEILNVETIGIIDLIKEQRITGNENTLVLDLPCLSLDILNELKSKEILTLFQEIYVCAGKESLFINGSDIKTITETLNNAFYEFVSKSNSDLDICTHQFEFNPLLERVHVQKTEILDLQAQIKLVVDTHQELENEKEELKVLLTNSQVAFSEVQTELSARNEQAKHLQDEVENLQAREKADSNKAKELEANLKTANKTVEDYSKQVHDLNLNKESLEAQLLTLEDKLTVQIANTKQLESELQTQQDRAEYLQEETEKLQASKKATTHKIEVLESDLQTANNTVVDYAKQMTDLNLNLENLETKLRTAEGDLTGRIKAAEQLESELKIQQERGKQFQGKINELQASEKEKLDKIEVLEADLKTANKTVKLYSEQINNLNQNKESLEVQLSTAKSDLAARITTVGELENQLEVVQDECENLTKKIESLTGEIQAKTNSIAALETKLSSVSDNATVEIDTLAKDNEKLTSALAEEKARADKAHANEQSLKAVLSEQESHNKQTFEAYESELQELKTKLIKSEEKQKETHGWFASRKQQAEALTKELEALKRENALLASNNETALAVGELENKLTAMLNKQNEDSIEIANALGKHITRCHEEQKSNISSQFELRKLTAFSRIPISTNSYDIDSANLAELSSLVSQNTYDVIIEFGCGLSTVVSASTLQDKAGRGFNNGKYLEDKGNNSEIEKALPKHIVCFEQSSERLKETTGLLSIAGVEAYVDLCHAPMISVGHKDNAKGGELFYDCTEKLLELKRILNNRNANILVVINGPVLDDDNAKYWALPLVLDYFSQADITVFSNGTNSEQVSDLIPQWEDECERRQLTANVKKLKTPKGVTIITIQS